MIPEPTDELVVIAEDDSLITFQSQPMITDEGRNVAREIPAGTGLPHLPTTSSSAAGGGASRIYS